MFPFEYISFFHTDHTPFLSSSTSIAKFERLFSNHFFFAPEPEKIKEDFIYIIECIENSPEQDKEVTEYVWQYLYGDTLYKLDDNQLIELADSIFIFAQKLKFKLSKLDNVFEDDDWFELKDILDEYEIY